MNDLEAAVLEVASTLESLKLPYMLVGGLAVAIWGEPRATLDVDCVLWTDPERFDETVQALSKRLRAVPHNLLDFARQTRVLPVRSSRGVRADLIFAALPWERRAIDRAQSKKIAGEIVPVASVEDLVLMKLVSERKKDQEDARRLLRRFRLSVDRDYLAPLLAELAEALGRPEIMQALERESTGDC